MPTFKAFIKGKRITLMGLGLLGRGVGDAEFLARCGADVIVTDKKSEAELAESVVRLKQYPNVSFKLGGHDVGDFTHTDLVLKAAGVRLDSPEIAAARAAGVQVVMSTALFAKYAMEAGAVIVGVTGTRGKSTVAAMIHHSLIRANKRTVLGGNVRGVSTLAMLPQIENGDIVVLELDSWQLQGFGDLKISPNISVFTNLMPDHLNYYPDMGAYFADKANIFRFQKAGDVLICGPSIEEKIKAARAPQIPPAISPDWKLKVLGEHNKENAALAAEALRALGLTEKEIKAGLESFEPVEGRLQLVREVKDIKIYNDNNATTPEATISALRALGKNKNVTLIVGGADKGLDISNLVSTINETCKCVVLLQGSGTDTLLKPTTYNLQPSYRGPFGTLAQAVEEAFNSASAGDVMLFSPAFASFGMFKNEYDRNDQFMAIVRKMEASA